MNPAEVELVCRLDQARSSNARAFVVVATDDNDGTVVHATGPFPEAEQALAQAGRDHADWQRHAEPGEGEFSFHVVPLWEPSQ